MCLSCSGLAHCTITRTTTASGTPASIAVCAVAWGWYGTRTTAAPSTTASTACSAATACASETRCTRTTRCRAALCRRAASRPRCRGRLGGRRAWGGGPRPAAASRARWQWWGGRLGRVCTVALERRHGLHEPLPVPDEVHTAGILDETHASHTERGWMRGWVGAPMRVGASSTEYHGVVCQEPTSVLSRAYHSRSTHIPHPLTHPLA